MEHGQGVEDHVVGPEAPRPVQGGGVGSQVGLGEHGSLGPARGPARVEHGRHVPGRHSHVVEYRALRLRRLRERPRPRGVGGQNGGPLGRPRPARVPHEHRGLGVGHQVSHLFVGVGRVQGQQDGPRPQAGQIQQHGEGRLLDLYGHALARPDAMGSKGMGQLGRALPRLAVADGPAPGPGEDVPVLEPRLLPSLHVGAHPLEDRRDQLAIDGFGAHAGRKIMALFFRKLRHRSD